MTAFLRHVLTPKPSPARDHEQRLQRGRAQHSATAHRRATRTTHSHNRMSRVCRGYMQKQNVQKCAEAVRPTAGPRRGPQRHACSARQPRSCAAVRCGGAAAAPGAQTARAHRAGRGDHAQLVGGPFLPPHGRSRPSCAHGDGSGEARRGEGTRRAASAHLVQRAAAPKALPRPCHSVRSLRRWRRHLRRTMRGQ